MADPVATTISILALLVSSLTAWINLLRRGVLRMTRPTFIAFKYDKTGPNGGVIEPKIFIRGLLYSTGSRGRVVENMYVKLHLSNATYDFTVWGHGNASLSRGSGLFVPPTGIAENHHFNPVDGTPEIRFSAGEYVLKVFAEIVGNRQSVELCKVKISVPNDAITGNLSDEAAIWFDWNPNKKLYHAHVESRASQIGSRL